MTTYEYKSINIDLINYNQQINYVSASIGHPNTNHLIDTGYNILTADDILESNITNNYDSSRQCFVLEAKNKGSVSNYHTGGGIIFDLTRNNNKDLQEIKLFAHFLYPNNITCAGVIFKPIISALPFAILDRNNSHYPGWVPIKEPNSGPGIPNTEGHGTNISLFNNNIVEPGWQIKTPRYPQTRRISIGCGGYFQCPDYKYDIWIGIK